jgi:hypothetical protein
MLYRHVMRTFAIAVLAAALLAGCGGGGEDRTSGLTAQEVLDGSREASAQMSAYRLGADGTIAADARAGELPDLLDQILAAPVDVNGEGPVNGGSASFDVQATLSGLPALQGNITKVGDTVYLGLLGTDYRLDLPPEPVTATQPSQIVAGLLGWVGTPTEVGREKVDGVDTVHLAAEIEVDEVLADLSSLVGTIDGSPVSADEVTRSRGQLDRALSKRTIDVWIGTEDLLPRRIVVAVRYAGRVDALRQLRSADLDLDLRVTDIGDATEITAPETTEALDLDRLGSLAGG